MAITDADIPDRTEAPLIPSSPEQMFRCAYMQCTLRGSVCVQRQTQTVSQKHGRGEEKISKAFKYSYCGSGACEQGHQVAAALAGKVAAAPELKMGTQGNLQRVDAAKPGVMPDLTPRPPAPDIIFTTTLRPAEQVGAPRAVVPPPAGPARGLADASPGAPLPPTKEPPMKCIDPEGCERDAESKGRCGKHYQRWVKAGRPGAPPAGKPAPRTAKPKQRDVSSVVQSLLGVPAQQLPDPRSVPSEYLLSCARELKRRAAELYTAARSMGFDPANPDTPPT